MRTLRVILGVCSALVGNMLLLGAAYTMGNYLFEWDVNKVSVEWQTSLFFAAIYAALGILPALFASLSLRGTARTLTVALTSIMLVAAWSLVCVLCARMNPGYLWLLIGVPLVAGYFAVRGVQHLRARAA